MGYCKVKNCKILKQHILRRRERNDEVQYDDDDDGLVEIIRATLNALHSYTLHKKKDLYRLQRENGNFHFITPVIHDNDVDDDTKNDKEASDKAMLRINFGESILKWFEYKQEPQIESLRISIISNPSSTISASLFLKYCQECFIKMINNKEKQYTLEELVSLKMYTDTNEYQSCLRRAHWKGSSIQSKQSFYVWALQIFKASLFHSVPIARWTMQSKKPINYSMVC